MITTKKRTWALNELRRIEKEEPEKYKVIEKIIINMYN